MTTDLDALRREHNEVGIGPLLMELLARIVRATAPTYPPAIYGARAGWDEDALEDLLQDWVEARLLRRGNLAALMATATSANAFRRALTTSLGQHLVDRRHRSSATNLFQRTRAALQTGGEFVAVVAGADVANQSWTLRSQPTRELSSSSTEELVRLSWEVSDADLGVVRYGPFSLKSSPILRAAGLHAFLIHLLSRSDGALSLGAIAAVMRQRFNLWEFRTAELADVVASEEFADLSAVEDADLARSVVARLGKDAGDALRAFHETKSLREAGVRLRIPTARVREHVCGAMRLIADLADTSEEGNRVYELVVESLFREE